jgi:hypothetical protein
MKAVFAICALAAMGLMAAPARADMSAETARTSVAPFYKALNAEFAKESPDLVRQATDRRAHARRRQDDALLPHRGLDGRGPAVDGKIG